MDVVHASLERVFRSPFPDIAIPEIPLTRYVLRRAQDLSSKAALIDGFTGERMTYGELADAVRRTAVALSRRGFRRGDVCALWGPNLPQFAVAYHAVATLGGVNTTINPLATVDELTGQLVDSGASCLVTGPPLVPGALEAARRSRVKDVLVFGEAEGATPLASLLEEDGPLPDIVIDTRNDVVALPYSSGTTGLPKGVMLTHHNLVANMCQMDGMEPVTPEDVLIAVVPFFHIFGQAVVLNRGLANGATIVCMPRFEMAPFLDLLERYAVTRAYLVPPIVSALAKNPEVGRYDLSKLRVIISAAAPLSIDIAEACASRLGCTVKQGFGMTETSPATHVATDDSHRPGSVGLVIRNTECQVVDSQTGTPLGPGEPGEIWVRGPGVMKGYLNQPAATADIVDSEGWLHTGDIGYVDHDGFFYIVDRLKELIKYKGYQVAPAELEAVLLSHAAVTDAAVVRYPDEEAGEIPKAFVVSNGEGSAEEILAYVAERVAPYKRIRLLEFVDQIPKSPSGKILRRVLVERDHERLAGAPAGGLRYDADG